MCRKNPFEKTREEVPLMKILVKTGTFAKEEVISENSSVNKLIEMSAFSFLEIYFLETDSEAINEKLRKKGEEIIFNPNSRDRFDYIVAKGNSLSVLKGNQHISADYAMELIRILLVNLGIFKIAPNNTVEEVGYYLYRYKKIFDKYQYAWTVAVKAKEGDFPIDAKKHLESLATRLEYVCRASDKVSYYSLQNPGNDTKARTAYHFSYMIFLATGIFDDLAWIIDTLNKLQLSKYDVELKDPKKMCNRLGNKNRKLSQYLLQDSTQNLIKLFYPMRDKFMHRKFIRAIGYTNPSKGYRKNLFSIPPKVIERIKSEFGEGELKKWGLVDIGQETHMEAHFFSKKAMGALKEVVNGILGIIDWDEYVNDLSEEDKKEIKNSHKKYKESLANFLRMWKPIYF